MRSAKRSCFYRVRQLKQFPLGGFRGRERAVFFEFHVPRFRRFGLILEPAAGLLEIKNRSTSHDAYSTARHFLNRILNSAMAIRRQ
jgi:hypothetical protein